MEKTPDKNGKRPSPRSLIPYFLVAVTAATMCGWYFFAYVPPKLQYFMGLRFRTLAVAARQVKGKVESLSAALKTALETRELRANEYLRLLVPDLQDEATGPAEGLDFLRDNVRRRVAWGDIMSQAAAISRRDFDDLLLADSSGQVLWQREATSPRVGNLTELLEAPADTEGWFPLSFRWSVQTTPLKVSTARAMPLTATLKVVNLDGQSSLLLTQPVSLATTVTTRNGAETRFFVAGLVSRSALQRQATHIPTEWVIRAVLPFVLLFLVLPFVKLATVTSKERFGFADVVLLALSTILIAAIGGAFPFMATASPGGDESLTRFAADIDEHLRRETVEFLDLTATITRAHSEEEKVKNALAECQASIKDGAKPSAKVCDFWSALVTGHGPSAQDRVGASELDVIVWVDDRGWQDEKWTTKQQVTGRIFQASYQHFRDIKAGQTWALKGTAGPRFTIEPLRSPTTSEMAFIFATPTGVSSRPLLALNLKPQSLVDVLVPPGYGFAILAQDGQVLFHSQADLSLEEHFPEEVGNPEEIAAAMRTSRTASWQGDYHGRPHRFYAKPVDNFLNCPWRIVTFREMEPVLAITVAQQTGALELFLVNLLVLGAFVAIGAAAWRARGLNLRDVLMSAAVRSKRPEAIHRSILLQLVVVGVALAVLASTYYAPQRWLDAVYFFFLVLPLVAVCTVGLGRWTARSRGAAAPPAERRFWQLAVELCLLTLLIGALPAAGFARIVYRVDELQRTVQWLEESRQQSLAREARIRGRIMATPNYSDGAKQRILDVGGFAASRRPETERTGPLYSYQHVLRQIRFESHGAGKDPAPAVGHLAVENLLAALRLPFSSSAPPVDWDLSASPAERYRASGPDAPDQPGFAATYEAALDRDVRSSDTLAGLLIVAWSCGALSWARKRLSARVVSSAPSLTTLVTDIESSRQNPAILVIGAPRLKKDLFVRDRIKSVTGQFPSRRILLLDAEITPVWLEREMLEVQRLSESRKSGDRPIWIHVSNLETQLVTSQSRAQVLRLLEQLMERMDDQPVKAVVVTSTIDPVSHFADVFQQERQEIYANAIPEVELNRSSLILSRFRRCYMPIGGESPWELWLRYDPLDWRRTLKRELGAYEPLASIRTELEELWYERSEVPMEELRQAVRTKAEAHYHLLWTSCTRSEKLVLIQLAQESVVNPKSRDTVEELMAKGLLVADPAPTLFNYTFRDFLRRIERSEVVQEWERGEGSGVWVISGRLLSSVLVVGGVFFLLTQGISVQSLLPILSGSGLLGVPLMKELVARMSSGGAGARAPAKNA